MTGSATAGGAVAPAGTGAIGAPVALSGAGALPTSPGGSGASSTPVTAGITVAGTGTVQGVPDVFDLALSVQDSGATVTAALDASSATVRRILASVNRDGVAAADVTTSGLSTYPQTDSAGTVTGYQADRSLTVVLRSLPAAGRTVSDAVAAGGSSCRVDGLSPDLQRTAGLLADARARAFADAKSRAAQYAQLAGRPLGPLTALTETLGTPTEGRYAVSTAAGAVAQAAVPVPVSPGSAAVTVTLTAVFALG